MSIQPLLDHARREAEAMGPGDYTDGYRQALVDIANLWAEWETCGIPSEYHDDGSPITCELRAEHDGEHGADGITWPDPVAPAACGRCQATTFARPGGGSWECTNCGQVAR